MCDSALPVIEEFTKKNCEIMDTGAWIDSEGACAEKKRNKEECRGCKFWRGDVKIKI